MELVLTIGKTMPQELAISQQRTSFVFAHLANITRCQKLLRTRLTEQERTFIQRRLEEERRSVVRLAREISGTDTDM